MTDLCTHVDQVACASSPFVDGCEECLRALRQPARARSTAAKYSSRSTPERPAALPTRVVTSGQAG